MIESISPDAADDPFHLRILPGRSLPLRCPYWQHVLKRTHILDQVAGFFGDRRSPGPAAVAEPPPVIPKPFLLPSDGGAWLNESQRLLPARPNPSEPSPEQASGRLELWALDTVWVDGELMSQRQDFELHSMTRLEPRGEVSEHG